MPLVNLTRATLRRAEFGFLGAIVLTLRQTPRLKGEGNFFGLFLSKLKFRQRAGAFGFFLVIFLGFLTN